MRWPENPPHFFYKKSTEGALTKRKNKSNIKAPESKDYYERRSRMLFEKGIVSEGSVMNLLPAWPRKKVKKRTEGDFPCSHQCGGGVSPEDWKKGFRLCEGCRADLPKGDVSIPLSALSGIRRIRMSERSKTMDHRVIHKGIGDR